MLWRQLDFVKELVPWVFVVQIVYASIQFIASVCLLVGIVKNKAGLMKPWLFLTMFTLLVSHEFTVWKFHDFSITHILREINFWYSRCAKSAILTHLEALNFDFL